MILQHNLMAMNANRMFGVSGKKQSKSTEKLSSGYRINRSADDAAGLSISEKMRRQIRGLGQASLNAQDGISFVQSAEGALNEVHDLLQRGNELAVKAGNDTNMALDRDYIFEEIKQINREVDRIARTTAFNDMNIFDSSNAPDEDAFSESITLKPDYMTYDMLNFTDAIKDALDKTGKTFTQQGIANFANALKTTYMPKLLGNIVNSLPTSSVPTIANMEIGLKMYCENDGTLAYVSSNGASFQLGVNLGYLEENSGTINLTPDLATTISHEMTHAVMFDTATNGMLGTNGANAFPSWFIEGTAQAVGGAINYCATMLNPSVLNNDKNLSQWLSRLTNTSDSYNAYAQGYIGSMFLGYMAGGGGTVNAATIANGLDKILKDISDGYSLSQSINRQTNGKYADLADFEKSFKNDAVAFTRDLVNAIGSGTGSIVSPNGLSGSKSSLLNGSNTNSYFKLNVDSETVDNYAAMQTAGKNPWTGGGATTTNGTDRDGNVNPDAKERWGNGSSGSSSGDGTVTYSGEERFIQVGAEAGQHINIRTFCLSTVDLGIADVKVDSMESAGMAIDKYKSAIKSVSSMRSEYGAIQNRLEHTTLNLNNVGENTQAAESRIRDTDMATEMVAYSNNNILLQAGQAMLAQANQLNQGVLTLLG